ncbi:histidine phosphatase family protein [Holospora curviuscula]|uniref:Alpha-ribazole phosphatase n=1 Tax=Holospora curviuscula TaxID=1082868 RepID=A0A2S5R867_9PROT|nr:histidine phosphatase family protein [Holospora curviuscula]PPE03325.1 Alpha-ribazole phosphatase [Holospora curviuscula]
MKGLPLKPFYFLRHGETDWNLEHRAMGSQDVPLNDLGVSQAFKAAELLKNEPIATIVSSPLLRARKTADIIAQHIKAPVIEITELQEACWGEKEGKLKGNGLWINCWRNGDDVKGAEGYADFSTRIKRGLEKALQHNDPILIVSHGGVYWVVQEILGLPIIDLGNAEPIFHRPPQHPSHPWAIYPLSEERNLYDYE